MKSTKDCMFIDEDCDMFIVARDKVTYAAIIENRCEVVFETKTYLNPKVPRQFMYDLYNTDKVYEDYSKKEQN